MKFTSLFALVAFSMVDFNQALRLRDDVATKAQSKLASRAKMDADM
jgi:hypothetical protein